MVKHAWRFGFAGLVAGASLFFGMDAGALNGPKVEPKADHRDSGLIVTDPAADIADVFAFVNPNDTSRVVLAVTVNPFQAPGNSQFFSPNVLYQLLISNTGDAAEELTIQVTFSEANGDQKFKLVGPSKPPKVGVVTSLIKVKDDTVIEGPADGVTVVTDPKSTIKVFAGLRDDPFFFDLIFGEKAARVIQGPPIAARSPGLDFFSGFNVSCIAVDLPASLLKGANSNTIQVWATTSRASSTKRSVKLAKDFQSVDADKDAKSFVQIETMGLPTVNVVLTNPVLFTAGDPLPAGGSQTNSSLKDAFNKTAPVDGKDRFRDIVVQRITQLSGDAAYAAETADKVIFPDVLTLDLDKPTIGFPNGRRPQDDVIDVVLNLVTKGGITTDNVNAPDVPILTDFPFFAAPKQATDSVPARDR